MTGTLDRTIAATIVLWGWRRLLAALVAGAVTASALAPLHLIPVLFVTLPVLVWLLDGATGPDRAVRHARLAPARAAFAIGWAFGFGYFLAGFYWVGFAILVDLDEFAWVLPLAIVVLPACLALFTGLSTLAAWALWGPGYRRVIVLAAAWTAAEWLRSVVLTGFPWNLLGQVFAGSDAFLQPAAYVGDLGLSIVVILIAAAPATLADAGSRKSLDRRAVPSLAALAALAAIWAGGTLRLAEADPGTVPGVALRIVQPNIAQSLKWSPELQSQAVARYLEMSDSATSPQSTGVTSVTHLIWPETALPLLLENSPDVMAQIAALLPDATHLITGALRAEPPAGGQLAKYFNSVFVIRGDGAVTAVYDKRHLVPFGEFLPFQKTLESFGLTQFTRVIGGFDAGDRAEPLPAGVVPRFIALICFEIIFSTDLIDPESRPGWLVNVTNDAWFGDSTGPWQHFAQARLRAVEQGLPVVRAANTGVSAVIDSYGRVIKQLDYGRRGVIDAPLPAPLSPTFYAQFGRLPVALYLMVAFSYAIALMMRDRHRTFQN